MLVTIQPDHFVNEFSTLMSADGFIDRFMILACKPFLTTYENWRLANINLQTQRMKNFDEIYIHLFHHHEKPVTYVLDNEAQIIFESICDNYSEHVMNQYNVPTEDDYDKDEFQSNSRFNSAKEVIHILKIACNLHLIKHYSLTNLNGQLIDPPPTHISANTIRGAQKILHVSNHHKYTNSQIIFDICQIHYRFCQIHISLIFILFITEKYTCVQITI